VAFLAIVAGIAGTFVGVISGRRGDPWHDDVFVIWVAVLIIAGALAFAAAYPDLAEWLSALVRGLRRAASRSPRLITDRWQYASDGTQQRASALANEITLPGTSERREPDKRRRWVRYTVLVACSQLGPDTDGAQLWASFRAFLGRPQISNLLPAYEKQWTQWATNWLGVVDAVLLPAARDVVVASARLEIADGSPRSGRDARFAMFILHLETGTVSPPPAAPELWDRRLASVLGLPAVFAEFLSGELRLKVSGQPPAQVSVRLEAQEDMAEMIDITGMKQLPGTSNKAQAIGYFTASPDGAPAADAARRMVTDVLRYALHVSRASEATSGG
jgi:hypothetical protein